MRSRSSLTGNLKEPFFLPSTQMGKIGDSTSSALPDDVHNNANLNRLIQICKGPPVGTETISKRTITSVMVRND